MLILPRRPGGRNIMSISLFGLYKIGIGPSSSHTVGPMWAALRFTESLASLGLVSNVARLEVHLYGSLALTGKGHDTDKAVILGLLGKVPDKVGADEAESLYRDVLKSQKLALPGGNPLAFTFQDDPQPVR